MANTTTIPPHDAQPAWEVATLFPHQGQWSDGDYLALNRVTNRLVELANGQVEVLPMPTRSHQRIVLRLADVLRAAIGPTGLGEVLVAPYPLRTSPDKFREPDVLAVLAQHVDLFGEDFAVGADVVIEVVSDDRHRDLVVKRQEYAAAGIAEYWIVDPREALITILALAAEQYVVHAEASLTGAVTSRLLPSLTLSVSKILE